MDTQCLQGNCSVVRSASRTIDTLSGLVQHLVNVALNQTNRWGLCANRDAYQQVCWHKTTDKTPLTNNLACFFSHSLITHSMIWLTNILSPYILQSTTERSHVFLLTFASSFYTFEHKNFVSNACVDFILYRQVSPTIRRSPKCRPTFVQNRNLSPSLFDIIGSLSVIAQGNSHLPTMCQCPVLNSLF